MPPNTQCIWSRTGCYTWDETYRMSNKYGNFLQANGVVSGSMVGFYLMNSPEFVFTSLGTWSMGSGLGWINYHLAGDSLVHCLKVSTARVVIVDEDEACRARIEEVRERIEKDLKMKIIILDAETRRAIDAMPDTPPDEKYRRSVKPMEPALLMYTSGSTGFPKACPLRNVTGPLFSGRSSTLGLKPGPDGDRWYNCMPL